jgi:hypothetical protein
LTGDPVPIARQVMNAANVRAVYSVSNTRAKKVPVAFIRKPPVALVMKSFC